MKTIDTISSSYVFDNKIELVSFFNQLTVDRFHVLSKVAIWTEVPAYLEKKCGVICERTFGGHGEFQIIYNPHKKTKEEVKKENTFYFDENEIVG